MEYLDDLLNTISNINDNPNNMTYQQNETHYKIICWDSFLKHTIIIDKSTKFIKTIQDDYCKVCKLTTMNLLVLKDHNICYDCKCITKTCTLQKVGNYDLCKECKCQNLNCGEKNTLRYYCRKCVCNGYDCNRMKFNDFNFCKNCKCINDYCNNTSLLHRSFCEQCLCFCCGNAKFPDEEYCEDCPERYFYSSDRIHKCEYDDCNKKINICKTFCKNHKCVMSNCQNQIDMESALYIPKFSPSKYVCVCHNRKDWTPDEHFKYPIDFKMQIMILLLVLKRCEVKTKIRIPKFVKFLIFKEALCQYIK